MPIWGKPEISASPALFLGFRLNLLLLLRDRTRTLRRRLIDNVGGGVFVSLDGKAQIAALQALQLDAPRGSRSRFASAANSAAFARYSSPTDTAFAPQLKVINNAGGHSFPRERHLFDRSYLGRSEVLTRVTTGSKARFSAVGYSRKMQWMPSEKLQRL